MAVWLEAGSPVTGWAVCCRPWDALPCGRYILKISLGKGGEEAALAGGNWNTASLTELVCYPVVDGNACIFTPGYDQPLGTGIRTPLLLGQWVKGKALCYSYSPVRYCGLKSLCRTDGEAQHTTSQVYPLGIEEPRPKSRCAKCSSVGL